MVLIHRPSQIETKMAKMVIYGPYSHVQPQYKYTCYGYPWKEGINTTLTMLISAQLDTPPKSYAYFTILGQIYFLKMAIFDQFYQHRKEWSYSDFKDLFGNGMAVGTKWEGGRIDT